MRGADGSSQEREREKKKLKKGKIFVSFHQQNSMPGADATTREDCANHIDGHLGSMVVASSTGGDSVDNPWLEALSTPS
jgi:hypothetical protein